MLAYDVTAEAVSDIVGKGAQGASGPAQVSKHPIEIFHKSFSFILPVVDQFFCHKVAAGSERVVTMLPNNAIVETVYKVKWQALLHTEIQMQFISGGA